MGKKLKIGDPAPELKAKSIKGNDFDLKSLEGKKPVVLVFSRYFGCPVCQDDFDKLLEVKGKIMEKAELVYITQSSIESATKFLEKIEDIDFTILCDPEKPYPVYKAFNVGKSSLGTLTKLMKAATQSKKHHGPKEGSETQSPADIVIDKDGKLVYMNYSLLNVDALMQAIGTI
ncbi:MAG: peroxiredoxin-like family protein [Candidatus Hodarchaeota archaeon]